MQEEEILMVSYYGMSSVSKVYTTQMGWYSVVPFLFLLGTLRAILKRRMKVLGQKDARTKNWDYEHQNDIVVRIKNIK